MTRLVGEGPCTPGPWPRDDRGRRLRSLARTGTLKKRMRATKDPQLVRRAKGLDQPDGIGFGVLVLVILASSMVRGRLEPSIGESNAFVLSLVVVVVIALPLSTVTAPRYYRRLRSAWLAFDLCPACGASMAGVGLRADGRRVCGTCGSAWAPDDSVGGAPS